MADYFTHFSAVLEGLTKQEASWVDQEYRKRITAGDLDESMGDFDLELEDDDKGGRRAWIHSPDGCENIDHVADFIQQFLKEFRPKEAWSMEWSNDCSKPRLDAFGGGALVVTAKKIHWMSTSDWVSKTMEKLKKR